MRIRNRFATTMIAATALALPAAATTLVDPDNPTPEDEAKLKAATAFLEKGDAYFSSVNHIDASTLPVTFSFVDVVDHPVVDVAVAEGDPVPLMFDTGAPTRLTQALATAHGGEVVVENLTMAGGGVMAWSPLRMYPKFEVGDAVTITKALGEEGWKAPGALHCVSPHGLLGASAMSNAVWQVNYGKKQITAAASIDQLKHIEGAIKVPFVPGPAISPTPHLKLKVGERTLDFLVDTGGGIPMVINTADIASAGVEIPKDAPAMDNLGFGAEGAFASPMTQVALPIKFGDTELVVPAMVGDGMAPGANGNIGNQFLQHFVVTFDFTTDTLYLDPQFEGNRLPEFKAPPGAGILWMDDKLVVGSIPKGGPADEAGLTVGKVVTRIDGKGMEGMTIDAYCDKVFGAEFETITTEDGKTFDVSPVEDFFTSKQ